jgi:RimJ/RimL family protein N-acetyltransferase
VTGQRPVLETERLRLRPLRPDDLDCLARWNADPRWYRFLSGEPMTREQAEATVARYLAHWDRHGFGQWIAEDRQTGEPVGRIGLTFHRAWPSDPEVGWALDPTRWGSGLATEGGGAALRYGFDVLGFPRIVSITTEENLASRRVMEKLGLRYLTEVDDEPTGLTLWVHVLDAPRASEPR